MSGRYRTIVADPPWPYPEGFATQTNHEIAGQRRDLSQRPPVERRSLPYQSMTLEEIGGLPISALTDTDVRLFLWTTNRHLLSALALLPRWGFEYRQLMVWDKTPNFPRLGGSVAPNSGEFFIVATKGKPERTGFWPTSIIRSRRPRTVHSCKPEVFLDLVEHVSPGPYVELFARRARFGWDYWGDESLGTVDLTATGGAA